MNKRNQKGFTLVELIVVIAIVAILAAVGIVAYSQYISSTRNSKAQIELDRLVNVLYTEASIDGIYVDDADEPTKVVSPLTANAVKIVSTSNGKLVIGAHKKNPGSDAKGKDLLEEGLTLKQLEVLIKSFAEDFTGKFVLKSDKLIYEVGEGKGEISIFTHPDQPIDEPISYKKS